MIWVIKSCKDFPDTFIEYSAQHFVIFILAGSRWQFFKCQEV